MGTRRTGSYLLAIFALVWLGMIYASERVTDGRWSFTSAVNAEFSPAVAVPVLSHGTLESVVLYGLHANGADLDADEVTLLERLCAAAGFALDRLEAQALRREIDTLRGMVRA